MRLVQYVRMMPHWMANGDVFSATNVLARHPDWKKVLNSYPLDNRSKRLLGLQDYSPWCINEIRCNVEEISQTNSCEI